MYICIYIYKYICTYPRKCCTSALDHTRYILPRTNECMTTLRLSHMYIAARPAAAERMNTKFICYTCISPQSYDLYCTHIWSLLHTHMNVPVNWRAFICSCCHLRLLNAYIHAVRFFLRCKYTYTYKCTHIYTYFYRYIYIYTSV